MEEFIVASHITSTVSSPPSTVSIKTVRQQLPLPQIPFKFNSIPPDHAIFATALDNDTIGTILLRVIHGGLIIELVSLSTKVPPLHLVFPSLVLDAPAIFYQDENALHVLAMTESGSLHRIIVPIQGEALWKNGVNEVWPREYLVRNFPEQPQDCMVHAQGPFSIAVSLKNGSLLRLDSEHFDYEFADEEWTESLFHTGGFLSAFASFIPALHAAPPEAADIVSLATHPWPSDIGNVFTLSRDRTLRLWKPKFGCVATKTLPPNNIPSEQVRSPSVPGGSGSQRNQPLLDEARQNLLRVFSTGHRVYVLAFMPTQSSVTSGGFFCVIDATSDQLNEVEIINCSRRTVHCHLQDFIIQPGTNDGDISLVTLWESQGRSSIDKLEVDLANDIQSMDPDNPKQVIWRAATYPQEPELTPAYMEEELLTPGSLAEKFLENIFRPGMFSGLSVRTALERHIDASLALPGAWPAELIAPYSTLAENVAGVVGCTVNLHKDPQTGVLQYANYWVALKRDWEGFVARCREVERSARWPLSLSSRADQRVVIIERERAAFLVNEDLPIYLHRLVSNEHPIQDRSYELFGVAGALRQKIGPEAMSAIESMLVDMLHQEVAFSLHDMLIDLAGKLDVSNCLDEGSKIWFRGRIQHIGDFAPAANVAVDVVGAVALCPKPDPDAMTDMLDTVPQSEWSRSLTAAYVAATVEARYELSLSLMTLFLFLADEAPTWGVGLLADVFAIFKGAAMLRYVSLQPAEPAEDTVDSADELATAVQNIGVTHYHRPLSARADVIKNMGISHHRVPLSAPTSLVHILLRKQAESRTGDIPEVAHHFLDSSGLLQSYSPAHATNDEVAFCNEIRRHKFFDVARELLSYLPKTAGATFVLAQIWLDIGRYDDAAELFERVAGACGPHSALSPEDAEALLLVIPPGHDGMTDSEFAYYIHVSHFFKARGLVQYEVHFAELAISVAPPGSDTSGLWRTVAHGHASLGEYEEAYAALMAMPSESIKREFVTDLALKMCQDNAVARLMTFDFAGVSEEVEEALAVKARTTDPRAAPNYSRILYTWYIQRGEYRSAALAMYQRALKLKAVVDRDGWLVFVNLGDEMRTSYAIAINALSLVDEKSQWVILPSTSETTRGKNSSKCIPASCFNSTGHDGTIVSLDNLRRQCILLSAQIDIVKRDTTILTNSDFLQQPDVIVMKLVHRGLLKYALDVASGLNVDMSGIFSQMTAQCVKLSKTTSDHLSMELLADWLLTDNASTWSGTTAERGWKFLRKSLEIHDGPSTDHKYAKAVLEIVVDLDRNSPPPSWLVQTLESYHPEWLIRLALQYENIDDAVSYSLSMLKKSDTQLSREASQEASATWLPYALFDQVIVAASNRTRPPAQLAQLRTAVEARLKKVQKLSQKSA